MKGRMIVIDRLHGRSAAALIDDGRLTDLLIDPPAGHGPRPAAIYRAVADRPVKGQSGAILRLGDGQTGFLRQGKGISPGRVMLVQVNTHAEKTKASPVTTRLLFKSRYVIVTPSASGLNVARSIRDEAEHDRLLEILHDTMQGAPDDTGAILRSAAEGVDAAALIDDITAMRNTCAAVLAQAFGDGPALLLEAPSADYLAWRDWVEPDPDQVVDEGGSFETLDVWGLIDALRQPEVRLTHPASMSIEPTRALVAVDVNTGGDFSYAAGLKANLAAARDLPRQLSLRGLGGQIVVDFAPMGKKDRKSIESALRSALRKDSVETILVGWTPLGHFEMQRKRERLPLADLLLGLD